MYFKRLREGLRQEERDNNIRSTVISPGTVDTELHTTINERERREWTENLQQAIGLKSSDVAYVIGTSETAMVSEMMILPTKRGF